MNNQVKEENEIMDDLFCRSLNKSAYIEELEGQRDAFVNGMQELISIVGNDNIKDINWLRHVLRQSIGNTLSKAK